MRYLDRLGLAQRIVMLIGLGFGLMLLGEYLVSLDSPAHFGWFGYAPLTENFRIPGSSGLAAWQRLLIWLGLILVWSVVGVVLLKPRSVGADEGSDQP